MVLLTVTDSKSLNSVIDRINHFKKIIDCRWIFCHIASLFRPITIFNEDDCSVFGEDSVRNVIFAKKNLCPLYRLLFIFLGNEMERTS